MNSSNPTLKYSVEDLLSAGLQAYRKETRPAKLSDAAWLMNVAVDMTGPDAHAKDAVDPYARPSYNIWEAVTRAMYKQEAALTLRSEGQSSWEASQRIRALR